MSSHFIAQLTLDGGPNPADELANLLSQSKDPKNKHKAWFKSTLTRQQFEKAGTSICIIFYKKQDKTIDAVIARILNFEAAPREIEKYYQGFENLEQFWTLGCKDNDPNRDLVRVQFKSLNEIPGKSNASGSTACKTFDYQATHAFWEFDEGFEPLVWLRSLIKT